MQRLCPSLRPQPGAPRLISSNPGAPCGKSLDSSSTFAHACVKAARRHGCSANQMTTNKPSVATDFDSSSLPMKLPEASARAVLRCGCGICGIIDNTGDGAATNRDRRAVVCKVGVHPGNARQDLWPVPWPMKFNISGLPGSNCWRGGMAFRVDT